MKQRKLYGLDDLIDDLMIPYFADFLDLNDPSAPLVSPDIWTYMGQKLFNHNLDLDQFECSKIRVLTNCFSKICCTPLSPLWL